jgi:hypothetical protein
MDLHIILLQTTRTNGAGFGLRYSGKSLALWHYNFFYFFTQWTRAELKRFF